MSQDPALDPRPERRGDGPLRRIDAEDRERLEADADEISRQLDDRREAPSSSAST
jgi:hypothetical protein